MNEDELGLDSGQRDVLVLHDGTTMQTHGPARCFGEHCCIHKPSDHPLKSAPLTWNPDMKIMFRVCEHDQIHPDPDAMDFHLAMALAGLRVFYDGWHPCCDAICCAPKVPAQRAAGAGENLSEAVEEDEVLESFDCPACQFTNFFAESEYAGFCRRCHTYSGPSRWQLDPRVPCDECHRPNPPWWTDDQTWQDVTGEDADMALCPTCFLLRASDKGMGLRGLWQLYAPGELSNEPDPKPKRRRRR